MQTIETHRAPVGVRPRATLARREPAHQAYTLMWLGYTALPIIAGLDKFTHYLTDWTQYLAPLAVSFSGVPADTFMRGVGGVEVAAGLLVAAKPRWGAPIVGLWLCGIIVNLLLVPGFYDVALRDFGLAVGAFSLWRLSGQYGARV